MKQGSHGPIRDWQEATDRSVCSDGSYQGGAYSFGATTAVVALNSNGQLTLTVGSQPAHKLRPYQRRAFVIGELEGFRAEFHLGPDGEVDQLVFHEPGGMFVGQRTLAAARP